MELRKLTAIIRSDRLEKVEEQLKASGVKGLTVSQVKGYGEYANFFTQDWQVRHARIEIFTERANAERLVGIIMEAAHGGGDGDGIIAILPVDKIYRIRTKEEVKQGEI